MPSRSERELVIRADAGPRIGLGHLMRCLALAEAWASTQGPVTFVTQPPNESFRRRMELERFGFAESDGGSATAADLRRTLKVLSAHRGAWVAVDGYAFSEAYHRGLRASGHPVLVLDDTAHLPTYDVDLLLNQNAHAALLKYRTLPQTKRLLGLRYVLLRREFRSRRRAYRTVPAAAARILVTMGGADPGNATLAVVEALTGLRSGGGEATVVLGPENRHRAAIEKRIQGRGTRVELVSAVEDMSALMDAADLAIVTGGSSVWELAYLGVPALVLTTGPQEELLAQGLARERLFRVLGPASAIVPDRLRDEIYRALHDVAWRDEQSRKGRRLVDGEGADRVVRAMSESEEGLRA